MNRATILSLKPALEIDVSVQEAAIWAAVIERAIRDLDNPLYRKSAVRWLLSEDDDFGSFRWCCLLFNLKPETIRRKLANRLRPVGQSIGQ